MSLIEDPVVLLGQQLPTLIERTESENHSHATAADHQLAALERALSGLPARTLTGALIQTRVLFGLVEATIPGEEGDGEDGPDKREIKQLVASIARVLERATSLPREAFGGDFFFPLTADPFGPEPAFAPTAGSGLAKVAQVEPLAPEPITPDLRTLLTDAREIVDEYRQTMLNGIGHGPERPVPKDFEFREDVEYLDALVARIDGVLPGVSATVAETHVPAIAAE